MNFKECVNYSILDALEAILLTIKTEDKSNQKRIKDACKIVKYCKETYEEIVRIEENYEKEINAIAKVSKKA